METVAPPLSDGLACQQYLALMALEAPFPWVYETILEWERVLVLPKLASGHAGTPDVALPMPRREHPSSYRRGSRYARLAASRVPHAQSQKRWTRPVGA